MKTTKAVDEARQTWPIGSLQWAMASGKAFRRKTWPGRTFLRFHQGTGWVLDGAWLFSRERMGTSIRLDDLTALDYVLEEDGSNK